MRDASLADLGGEHWAKPVPPEPDGLMADVDPALGQQILDVAQRERISHVHHHDQTDNVRRTVEISERVAHGMKLPRPRHPRIWSDTALATTNDKSPCFCGANSSADCKDRLEHPATGRSLVRLICPDQRRLSQDVAAHGLLKLSLCWCAREVEFLIKGIKLEEIAVASDRRSRTAVAGSLPVIQPFAGSRRKRLTPSERLTVEGVMLKSTQCTQTILGAAGSGASGSSTIRARLFVLDGRPDHASGGDRSSPSPV